MLKKAADTIITITRGERQITISLEDSRSAGFIANGIYNEYEGLFDDGSLVNPEDKAFATDLAAVGKAARRVCNDALQDRQRDYPVAKSS